ncbi:MAG: Fe-S cluster assembly protein SufD [Pleurocapsa sp.]
MAVQIPFTKSLDTDNSVAVSEDKFLSSLLQQFQVKDNQPQWLKAIRQQASAWVSRLQTPSKKDENWRFIDLGDLVQTNFILANGVDAVSKHPSYPEAKNTRLVFVNGFYNAELSDISGLPEGIYVGNVDNLPENYNLQQYFAQQHGAQDVFTALNTAGSQDIAIVWVAKNIVVETPIHLVFISQAADTPSFSQPRTLIVAETSSSFSLIEEYTGEGTYFTNAVTEIWLQDNAEIKHTRLQQESLNSFHIAKTAVSQNRDSRYTINEINFGGKLYRHNPEILQQDIQTTTNLNGLTVATEKQVADTHSIVALTKPQGTTNQLHKCIVGDRAHSIFNGKIFVPKEAQLTDATQLNRNLLLSSKARVDTKPELQITADNVKCSHGATVSQLEAEEIFYLRSRGLGEADASQLLIDAFAGEIIERLDIESLKNQITQTIKHKINH